MSQNRHFAIFHLDAVSAVDLFSRFNVLDERSFPSNDRNICIPEIIVI